MLQQVGFTINSPRRSAASSLTDAIKEMSQSVIKTLSQRVTFIPAQRSGSRGEKHKKKERVMNAVTCKLANILYNVCLTSPQ